MKLLKTLYRYFERLIAYVRFCREYRLFAGLSRHSERFFPLMWGKRLPCLDENTATTSFDRHYIFHLAWAARMLEARKPAIHVDISSSVYFAAIISAFVPVEFYDFRPADLALPNLVTGAADLRALPFPDASITSLSCMHVVEHIGLGRYGDPLDPDGDLRAIAELTRVLAHGGILLFVVPVGGTAQVRFNAHRIYTYSQIVEYFNSLELIEYCLIPDNPEDGGLICGISPELADAQSYGCGCFRFRKAGTCSQ